MEVNSALTEIQLPDYSFSKRMSVPQSAFANLRNMILNKFSRGGLIETINRNEGQMMSDRGILESLANEPTRRQAIAGAVIAITPPCASHPTRRFSLVWGCFYQCH